LERAEELIDMLAATALGRIKPKISVYDCRMIEIMPTVDGPMRAFVDKVKSLEGKNRVLSISPVHGYTLGDVHDIGTKIMVVTDDDQEGGDRLAEALGRELYGLRGRLNPKSLSMEEALEEALRTEGGPVVIADRADNAGGGSPSDSTYFLRLLIERGIKPAAIGPIWDPIAVKLCFNAGEGASFDLRLGGKMGPSSGQPIDARVRVIACRRNAYQTFGKAREPLGDAVSVEIDGIAAVLISSRTQAFGTDLFSGLGIDPQRQKVIVVKSYAHFTAAFAPIARRILHTGGPGPLTLDPLEVPFRHVRRPIWPLDPEPFASR
jgi:microcystin degradation protein MlrC